MEIKHFKIKGYEVAEVLSEQLLIESSQDAFDIMANAHFQGAERIFLYEKNITPDFFDLKTGLAGEILQKYSNYQMTLSIIGDFNKFESKSLKAFMTESNRGKQIAFVPNREAAVEKL